MAATPVRPASPQARTFRSVLPLLGPAFVAAVAYVDPGNVATNVSAGVRFGYRLVWVVVAANLMACLVQYSSAKIGLVTGRSLPELVREALPGRWRVAYWLQAEVVAMATDVAEIVGGAIALGILFDLPLLLGGLVTAFVSMVLLALQGGRGQSTFERVVVGLLMVIATGFLVGVVVDPPGPAVARGLVPGFEGGGSVVLAAGMLGATVMPHVVYLHSALARDRFGRPDVGRIPSILRATRYDVGLAMVIAGAVNLSMVLVAATSLRAGDAPAGIDGAHDALRETLGPAVALLFALALLASGLASTSVGCYAGAVVMEGLLGRRVPLAVRRSVTVVPALVVLSVGVNATDALVLSQVVLSFGIPFALVPLTRLAGDHRVMGHFANPGAVTATLWVVSTLVTALNAVLVTLVVTGHH